MKKSTVSIVGILIFLSLASFAAINPFIPVLSNPNIPYRVVSTKYMNIVYEPGCEWAVYQFLKKCDEIYTEVTDFYDAQPFSKLTVVFENDTDIVNSVSDPVDNVIYIFLNSAENSFFSQDISEWVSFVFSHELTHILLTQMGGSSTVRLWGNALSTAYNAAFIPAYLQEGLAQYSETHFNSGHGRLNDPLFEMYLKGLVLSKEFKGLGGGGSYDANGWYPIGAPYILGGSFVRYVANKYGENVLKKAISNLAKNHLAGVAAAFSKATKTNFNKLIEEWKKSVESSANVGISGVTIEGVQLTHSGRWTAIVSTASTNSVFFYSENSNDVPCIKSYSVSNSSFRTIQAVGGFLYQGGYIRSMALSSDGSKLAFVRLVTENGGFENRARCFIMNLKNGAVKILPKSGILKVAWASNDKLVYIGESGGLYFIKEYNLSNGTTKTLLHPCELVITSIFANSKEILFSANSYGKEDIYELKNGNVYKIITGDYLKEEPYLTSDGRYILFSAAKPTENGIYNIYAFDTQRHIFYRITNVKLGAFRPITVGRKLVYTGYTPNGYNLFVLDRWLSTSEEVYNFKAVKEPYEDEINLTKVFLSVDKKSKPYSPSIQNMISGLLPLVSFHASSTTVKATYTVVALEYLRTKLGWNNLYALGALSANEDSDFLEIGMQNYGRYSISADLFLSRKESVLIASLSYPITFLLFSRDFLAYPSIYYSIDKKAGVLTDNLRLKGELLFAPSYVPNNVWNPYTFHCSWNVNFSPLKPATPVYEVNVDTSAVLFSTISKIGCDFENKTVGVYQALSFPKINVNWYNITGTLGWRYVNFIEHSSYDINEKDFAIGFLANFNFEFSSYGEFNAKFDISYDVSKEKLEYGFGLNF